MAVDDERIKLRGRRSAGRQSDLYEIEGDAGTLLKLFRHAGNQAQRDRIDRLIASGSSRLRARCAWPLRRLTVQTFDAVLVPCVEHGATLADLIPRNKRQRTFPGLTWRDMIRFAAQLADCAAAVHAENMLIGDFELHNVLIKQDKELILTRCDGFLLEGEAVDPADSAAQWQYPPPETNAPADGQLKRTTDHDNFTLARLIFQLVFVSDEANPDSVKDWAALLRTQGPSGAQLNATRRTMLKMLSPELVACFRLALDPSSTRSSPRPSAELWSRELSAMADSMRACTQVSTHAYRDGLESGCPWCALAAKDRELDEFSNPRSPPVGPRPPAPPLQEKAALLSSPQKRKRLYVGLGALACCVLILVLSKKNEQASTTTGVATLDERADALINDWFDAINAQNGDPGAVTKLYSASAVAYDGKAESQPNVFYPHIFAKYTKRDYRPVPGTLSTSCNPQNQTCTVNVTVRFEVTQSSGTHGGCWQYRFTVNASSQPASIEREDGQGIQCSLVANSSGASQ
ncbi:hypothetical protein AWB69_08971 [Caballeronia udeis]|uniref:Protein kinase domain-containing protein n=1 Tax=Caballeronia udeis TaxID=1232866 RepID=A0A158JX21_9BURK|nr:hypothetical protein [Caballeronia udeis]SAL73275.1 hypothetical protein AWB69_08971 [Caballeronia udeis]